MLPNNFLSGTGLDFKAKETILHFVKFFFLKSSFVRTVEDFSFKKFVPPNKLVSVNSLNKWSVNFDQVVTDQFHDFRSGPDGQIIIGTSH